MCSVYSVCVCELTVKITIFVPFRDFLVCVLYRVCIFLVCDDWDLSGVCCVMYDLSCVTYARHLKLCFHVRLWGYVPVFVFWFEERAGFAPDLLRGRRKTRKRCRTIVYSYIVTAIHQSIHF